MNWKLVTVVLISLILLVVCYLTLDFQRYFTLYSGTKKIPVHEPMTVFNSHKIKTDIANEEDFKNIKLPDGYVGYYFFGECPSYKQEYFLIDLTDEGLEKYHVPQQGHLVIVKKDHWWSKEPNFTYWKSE
jgi:hypothetical protein